MIKQIPGEYKQVSRMLYWSGHYDLCKKAHSTPISRSEADQLTLKLIGKLPRYHGKRGWAHSKTLTITLPFHGYHDRQVRADGVIYLRLGLVLHECAHIMVYKKYHANGRRVFGHGKEYCEEFGKLLCDYYNEQVTPPAAKKKFVFQINDEQYAALQERIRLAKERLGKS